MNGFLCALPIVIAVNQISERTATKVTSGKIDTYNYHF